MIPHRFLASRILASLVGAGALMLFARSARAEDTGSPSAPAAEPDPALAGASPVSAPSPAAISEPAPGAQLPPPGTPFDDPSPRVLKPKPAQYSLPWQLRPVAPGNVLRLDNSYAFYENPTGSGDKSGTALVSTLLGSYKIVPDLALMGRIGFVANSPPAIGAGQAKWAKKSDFLNPVIGALYGVTIAPSVKLGLSLGATLPMGDGGNSNSSLGKRGAATVGINTRSAFDNAMFAIDYFTVFPGVDIAFIKSGFTVQGEATLFKLTKVRDPIKTAPVEENSRVNLTAGVHAGYFITPFLSIGAELRHQRWLSTPAFVKAEAYRRDTTTFAVGPRFHVELAQKIWFRPGVSISLPLDQPMASLPTGAKPPPVSDFKVVQLDLPIVF